MFVRISFQEKESIESATEVTSIEAKADVMIRIAFAEFLMGPEMLGHLTNHLSIYRLFPRPVVSLRLTSFLGDYLKGKPNLDPEFIKHFVRTQVEPTLFVSHILIIILEC